MDKKKNIVEPLPKDLEEAIFGEIKQIDINISDTKLLKLDLDKLRLI